MNRLSIGYDERSTWSLDGEAVGPTRTFGSLPDALACARELTNAAEALIELRISGIYACVHQEPGWPHRIVNTPVRAAAEPRAYPRFPISRRQNPPGQSMASTAR